MDAIGRATAIAFTGFNTDVGHMVAGNLIPGGNFVAGTIPPLTVDRSAGGYSRVQLPV